MNKTELGLIKATINAQGYPRGPTIYRGDAMRMRIAERLCRQLGFALYAHPDMGDMVFLYHPIKDAPTPARP